MYLYYCKKILIYGFVFSVFCSMVVNFMDFSFLSKDIWFFISKAVHNLIYTIPTAGFLFASGYNRYFNRNEKYMFYNCKVNKLFLYVLSWIVTIILSFFIAAVYFLVKKI